MHGQDDKDSTRFPTIFVAHGAPPLLDDAKWVGELNTWAGNLQRPKTILMLSAHWEDRPVTIGATRTVPLIYDFYGFPRHHYEQKYAAPGAPALAERVRGVLKETQPVAEEPERSFTVSDDGGIAQIVWW